MRGKHKLNFDEILIGDDLFAITGQTGSGKSSILTAISLALYGHNYKKVLNSSDFITLGESSGSVKLTFTSGANIYNAHWECKVRKKNGELLKNPVTLRHLFKGEDIIEENA